MKGLALDLPFFRVRYVKIQGDKQKQVSSESRIKTTASRRNEGTVSRPIKVHYTEPAKVTTLGLDLMVSNASVIHELVYGRMHYDSGYGVSGARYPEPKESFPPALDLIV